MNTKVFDEICVEENSKLTQQKLKKLGENIKRLRIEHNKTQSDIAFYIFSDKSLISALERGRYKNITVGSIMKIATLFNVTVEDLLK